MLQPTIEISMVREKMLEFINLVSFNSQFNLKQKELGLVVQSIISLTSLLRGPLLKGFTTLLLNTLILFVEKMRDAFAMQKLLTLFQQKILASIRY